MWWLLAVLWKPDSFLYHPVRFKLLHSFIGLLSRATCVFHSSVVSPIQVLCIRLASGTCLCCLCWCCCCCCLTIFFSAETGARSPSPRIPQNLAEPEECGRRRANIEWSEPRLPNSFNSLQVSKCVTTTEARAAAGTHTGFRRDSTQNCFCYWCASVAVGVSHSLLSVLQIHAPFEGEEPCSQRRGPPTHKQGPYRSPVQALDPLWR